MITAQKSVFNYKKITSWVDGVPVAAGWASGQTNESGSPRLLASPDPAGTAGNSNFTAKTTVNKDDSKGLFVVCYRTVPVKTTEYIYWQR